MNARVKKAAIVIVKIAILACIVEFARRKSQNGDELALPAVSTPAAAELASRGRVEGDAAHPVFVFQSRDGKKVGLAPRARLTVVEGPRPGEPPRFIARSVQGDDVAIDAADVRGAPGAPSRETSPFTFLPGWGTLFSNLNLVLFGIATLIFGPPLFLMAVRLYILLVASGIRVPFFMLLRLHYMGFFFNSFMPGGAGGDVVKAVYLVRESTEKAAAATMVFIDRIIGVAGLLIVSGAVVLFDYEHLRGIAFQIGIAALLLLAGLVGLFSRGLRKLVRFDAIVARSRFASVVEKVDAAVLALHSKKRAVASALGVTILLQLLEVVGIVVAGAALGLEGPRFSHYLAFVPIGYLSNALPLSFGGIGLMEGTYLKLFSDAGVATPAQGFMLGVLARIIVLAWSLVGAVSALFPPARSSALEEIAATTSPGPA